MTINPRTLQKLRAERSLSQAELAEASGVSKKTISRIELGEIARPNAATKKKLAEAFSVDPADLAKAPDHKDTLERELKDSGYRKLTVFMSGKTALRYIMARYRYGISAQTLINHAPLFFTLLAEGSLAWRRRKVEQLQAAVEQLSDVATDAPHMAYASSGYRAGDAAHDELKSIEARDLFGERISEVAYDFGYDPGASNPFSAFLAHLVRETGTDVVDFDKEIKDDHMPAYELAREELEYLTNGDHWAEFALERGHARLSDIPEELFEDGRSDERAEWLASHIPADVRAKHEAWLKQFQGIEI